MPVNSADYQRSKALEIITWRELPLGKGVAFALLDQQSAPERQSTGQRLLDILDGAAGLPSCRLTVANRAQAHRTRQGRLEQKTYGYYKVAWERGEATRATIRIYNLTAMRQQVLAPKVFLETLLHEWVHHYDFTGLRLDRSPHTSGFFARIRDVAETLGVAFVTPPKRDEAGRPIRPPSGLAGMRERQVSSAGQREVEGPPPSWIREQIEALLGRRPR
jgi:hypothetical protein